MSVYCIATLDTKGIEIQYVSERLEAIGIPTRLVDVGCLGQPTIEADITRRQIFEAAGTTLEQMQNNGDRGRAVSKAAQGAAKLICELYDHGEVSGVLAIGGSAGT